MINALGLDKDSSFKAICDGKTGVKKITLFDTSDFPVQIAAEITDFDPSSVMDGKEIKKVETSDDIKKDAEERVQKLTDKYIKKVEEVLAAKEAEILKV